MRKRRGRVLTTYRTFFYGAYITSETLIPSLMGLVIWDDKSWRLKAVWMMIPMAKLTLLSQNIWCAVQVAQLLSKTLSSCNDLEI